MKTSVYETYAATFSTAAIDTEFSGLVLTEADKPRWVKRSFHETHRVDPGFNLRGRPTIPLGKEGFHMSLRFTCVHCGVGMKMLVLTLC